MTNDLMQQYAEQEAAERQAMADLVAEIARINAELHPLEAAKRRATDALKQYLALNNIDALDAPDGAATARLQDRAGTPTFDLVSAAESHPDAVIAAAKAGMVRLDHPMLSRFRRDAGASWADVLAGYEMPGTGTTALIVEAARA